MAAISETQRADRLTRVAHVYSAVVVVAPVPVPVVVVAIVALVVG